MAKNNTTYTIIIVIKMGNIIAENGFINAVAANTAYVAINPAIITVRVINIAIIKSRITPIVDLIV